MSKRSILAIFIAFILAVAASAMWSATTTERDGDPDANAIEDSGSTAGNSSDPNSSEPKKGNKVARIFSAPFKAFGRLFSHKDNNKLERMTEKDAEKFASVGVARVDDSRTPEPTKLAVANSAKEHLENGRSYLLNGQFSEAITELSTATSLDPKLTEAHNLLGVAYDKKGLADRAKESYEKAVKVEPEDAQALNNLGFSLYQNGNYRAAVDRLKRAVKLAPTDDRILNNLGLALCRLGKFDEAYKHFARAAGPYTGNLNTARMLERFGRDDEAIKFYEAARRIEPESTLAVKRLGELYKRTGRPDPSPVTNNAFAGLSASVAGK
ncbi:MAG TPA: tetratricopeptide repeat protein [Pyrinomonadaceae bacterium]|jgi:Flp pilus assembly protein TadD|nr:tetratricopeptide repeat protein [Pyrinomonadaceae bacterium]